MSTRPARTSWEEVVERFGWNRHRRRLLDGVADGLAILVAAGCKRVWLNGSFVSDCETNHDQQRSPLPGHRRP
ncbi:MAG: DUF6932 family protein, partial [Nocardioidaceae bacterium]